MYENSGETGTFVAWSIEKNNGVGEVNEINGFSFLTFLKNGKLRTCKKIITYNCGYYHDVIRISTLILQTYKISFWISLTNLGLIRKTKKNTTVFKGSANMTVFEVIRNLARQHDKNLQQVAEDLNFSKNLLYRWQVTQPKARDLAKVADYFNVSVDYLLGRNNSASSVEISDRRVSMTYHGMPLNDEDRRIILRVMHGK
ncbi:helix-turn-helix domain-containing protein [Ligilactobacillus sp. WILCCON 0076]|uniref:Helix-turn-helix domain-containing protein n=2 Tax=Ligilactobacillus ubinensis TaxID=2876789 RepID=A0A9X2FHD0_9LACO|nr:helix-turn-helix transcriptional regulator [Ligilactobacillus ubinensis]MCP0885804.1 helix-turn-helix domain-containing protein [Ligilactobacillus ubinensis]